MCALASNIAVVCQYQRQDAVHTCICSLHILSAHAMVALGKSSICRNLPCERLTQFNFNILFSWRPVLHNFFFYVCIEKNPSLAPSALGWF